jgi:signal transduction histidine kinase
MMNLKRLRVSITSDLGLQILALYAMFIVPIVVVALLFDSIAGRSLEREIQSSDLALAQAIAKETDTALRISLYAVEQLSQQPAVISAKNAGMLEIFEQIFLVRPDVNLVYRLDENGMMLFHYPVGPGSTLGVDFSFREYFQRALTTRQSLVSLGRISPTTNQPVATTIMPVWDDEQFLGVVGINLKLQSLSDTLASISSEYDPEEQFQVAILDTGGMVIANPDPEFLLKDFSEIAPSVTEALQRGESGNRIEVNALGQETLYSIVPVPNAAWGVVISRPTVVAFATPKNIHRGILLMLAAFLGIGLFFWSALSIRVIRPVERLAEYSRFLGGDLPLNEQGAELLARYSIRPDQVGHLIRSFKRMEAAIKARIEELGTLLETSAALVSTLESETVLERILEQVELLLGIKKSIIVALDEDQGVFRARASRGMSERYARSLEISPDEVTSVTMRAIRVGEPIQVRDTEDDPTFKALRSRARAEGYRSVAAIPLKTLHAPPSALNVYSPEPQVFNERELNLLSTFANQAAMAIENAELYSRSDTRLQEQTRRIEALVQSLEVGLILEDLEGLVLYTNRMVSEISDIPVDKITGYPVKNLFQRLCERTADPEKALEKMDQLLSGSEEQQEVFILPLEYPDGPRYLRLKGFTVRDARNVEIGRGQILQDITRDYEIDRMKTSLISTVSHELRTPLASIKGYATTLLAQDITWELQSQREFLGIISRDADRLSDLVDNLLDMSRIETGSLTLSKTACAMENIINEGIDRVEGNSNRQIQIDIQPDLPPVYVDAYRIEVVVRNLVENALKYSEADQPVLIRAFQREEMVVVSVEDQGPGIPGERVDDIFESFYRLDDGLDRRKPGVGLGLAICRGLVHAHGGAIWVEPRQVGACFAFSIPMINTEKLKELFYE